MTKLDWDLPGTRVYESGIDRGVLFVDGANGVPWNGLISVDEKSDGGDVESYYIDGKRYLNIKQSSDFAATVTAFSNPPEFDPCVGTRGISTGLYITNQHPKRFNFVYRTMVGNDNGDSQSYKLHLVYNAIARQSDLSYGTHSSSVDPLNKSYDISTVPVKIPGYKPTAHLVVDSKSTNPFILGYLEALIYGTSDKPSRMPSVDEVIALFGWIAPDVPFPINIIGEIPSDAKKITNLLTNTKLKGNGQRITVYENIFTNAGFEGTSPGVTGIRRNLFSDPIPASVTPVTSNLGRWFRSSGGTIPGAIDVDGWARFDAGGTAYTDGTIARASEWGANGIIVTASTDYTLSFEMEMSSGGVVPRIARYEYTSAGTGVGGRTNTALTFDSASGRYRTSFKTAATVERVVLIIEKPTNTISGTEWWRFRRTNFEATPVMLPYFQAGLTYPDPDLTPAFVGAANASPTVLNAALPSNPTGGQLTNNSGSACYLTSGAGVQNGSKALRIKPISSDISTHYQISGYNLSLFGAGKTYTAIAKITVLSAQTGTVSSAARRINAVDSVNSGVQLISAQAPNVPGTYELRLIWTVASNATWAALRLYNGASAGNGDVVYDDVTIVEGEYYGPSFHGGLPLEDPDFQTAWTGTINNSISRVTGEGITQWSYSTGRCVAIKSNKDVNGVKYPMRLISLYSTNDTFTYVTVPAKALNGGTFIGNRYQEALQPQPNIRGLWVGLPDQQIPVVNEIGDTEYRLVYDPITSVYTARCYHGGSAGAPDVWWRNPGIYAGAYGGPAFSGDEDVIFANFHLHSVWDGPVDNSTSSITYEQFLVGKSGDPGDTYLIDGNLWTLDQAGYWFVAGTVPI